MSRCLIFSVPVRIFVPLDTIRDYLFVEDAASLIVAGMRRLRRDAPMGGERMAEVFGSGSETSVAGLIGVFSRQIAKRRAFAFDFVAERRALPTACRVAVPIHPSGGSRPFPRTELLDGVNRVHNHQLALFQAGRLPSPWSGSLR